MSSRRKRPVFRADIGDEKRQEYLALVPSPFERLYDWGSEELPSLGMTLKEFAERTVGGHPLEFRGVDPWKHSGKQKKATRRQGSAWRGNENGGNGGKDALTMATELEKRAEIAKLRRQGMTYREVAEELTADGRWGEVTASQIKQQVSKLLKDAVTVYSTEREEWLRYILDRVATHYEQITENIIGEDEQGQVNAPLGTVAEKKVWLEGQKTALSYLQEAALLSGAAKLSEEESLRRINEEITKNPLIMAQEVYTRLVDQGWPHEKAYLFAAKQYNLPEGTQLSTLTHGKRPILNITPTLLIEAEAQVVENTAQDANKGGNNDDVNESDIEVDLAESAEE